ncbi:MAG: glutamine amidotransferase [Nocardioides sp.]|nr:glutamine amidotransferase [Nocardioides sp.]
MADSLAIVHVYPELLGTYGDRGNVLALCHRAEARGLSVRVVEVGPDQPLPRDGDVYVLGGGEDSAQLAAGHSLMQDERAADILGSHPCLAVCAGFQLLSRSFTDADDVAQPGLGLLDVTCGRLDSRAVGEVVADPVGLDAVPTLTGYENHRGSAWLGPLAAPLGHLVTGVGNGDQRTEGAVQGNVVATYLHGPVLVRNPRLADLLLSRVAGPLPEYDDEGVEQLRTERLDVADPRRHRARRALFGRR